MGNPSATGLVCLALLIGSGGCAHRAVAGRAELSPASLAAKPTTPLAGLHHALARLIYQNEPSAALAELEQLHRSLPRSDRTLLAQASLWIGLLQQAEARFPQAAEAFLRALEEAPTLPESAIAAAELAEMAWLIPRGHEGCRERLAPLLGRGSGLPVETRLVLERILRQGLQREGRWKEAAEQDRARGIPAGWNTLSEIGLHPLLDFRQDSPHARTSLAPSPGHPLVPLALDNGLLVVAREGAPGLLFLETFFRVAGPTPAPGGGHPATLLIEGDDSFSASLDNRLLARHDRTRGATGRGMVLPLTLGPGWHRLLIEAAVFGRTAFQVQIVSERDETALSFWVPGETTPQATELAGWQPRSALKSLAEGFAERALLSPQDPLGPLYAALSFWERGQWDETQRFLELAVGRADRFGLAHYFLGLLALDNPEVPAPIDTTRARAHLQDALLRCPGLVLARFRLALIDRAGGKEMEALATLGKLRASQPEAFLWPFHQGQIHEQLGWQREADLAYRAAWERLPDQPQLLQKLFQRAREQRDVVGSQRYAEQLLSRGLIDEGLVDFFLKAEQDARAAELLARLIERAPSRLWPRLSRADLWMAKPDLDSAQQELDEALGTHPAHPEIGRRLSDLADLRGQPVRARELRADWARKNPTELRARQAASVDEGQRAVRIAGERPIDGLQEIARYQAADFPKEGNAVLVLDSAAMEVAADGSSLERIHMIAQVLTAEGLEKWAEIEEIPARALVSALRTITRAGEIHDAEPVPGKSSISLPGLQIGDFVEISYLHSLPKTLGFPGFQGFSTSRWMFQTPGTPVYHSLFSVAVPQGIPLEIDSRNAVPACQRSQSGGFEVLTWEQSGLPMLPLEPLTPPPDEFTPWVQVGSQQDWRRYRDVLSADLEAASWPTQPIRKAAAELTAGLATTQDRVHKLYRFVCEEIRQTEPFESLGTRAAHVLLRREGNRLTLMVALLRALGIAPEAYLARTLSESQLETRFAFAGVYRLGLAAVALGQQRLWMDLSGASNPFGSLYPFAQGMKALWLTGGADGEWQVTLPTAPASPREKRIELELVLEANGDLSGQGQERLTTAQATAYRQLLGTLTPSQQRQVLETGLGQYFSGAILTDYQIQALKDPDLPLLVSYKFRISGYGRRQGDLILLPAGFYPYRLSPTLVQAASRKLPLLLEDETRNTTRVRLRLPPGAQAHLPKELRLEASGRAYHLGARQEGEVLILEKSLWLRGGRIQPTDYAGFREFCQAVDRNDTEEIQVLLKTTMSAATQETSAVAHGGPPD